MTGPLDLDTDGGGFAQGPPMGAPGTIVAELRYDSGLAVGTRGLIGAEPGAARLNTLLASHARRVQPRLPTPPSQQARRASEPVNELAQLPVEQRSGYAHAGFVEVHPDTHREAEHLLAALAGDDAVWRAHQAPQLTPAGTMRPAGVVTGRSRGSRNFEPTQGYLHAAPTGIGAGEAWAHPGGRGHGVTVCDIEGNWRRTHSDLPRGIRLIGGRPVPDEDWRDHGTAVLGELVARPGQVGLHGICPDATAVVQSAFYGPGVNAARAVSAAAAHLDRGDVLLLEVQALGPGGRYVTVLHFDDVYSAVLAALERGVVVVAAAGNGGVDFDTPAYRESNVSKDSGAILVGAGVPPANSYDVDGSYRRIGDPRSPMPYSNSGAQVVLQGWGWHVATLGFGDAQGGAPERWVTLRFSGTSSAAPMVAGAVACLQGIAAQHNHAPLAPVEVRDLLVHTATAQSPGRQIGGQPDLGAAIPLLLGTGP